MVLQWDHECVTADNNRTTVNKQQLSQRSSCKVAVRWRSNHFVKAFPLNMVTNERNDLLLYRYTVNIAPTNWKFLLRRSIRDVTQTISIKK